MMEGALYAPRRTNRTALAVVVLMHGAALTALALAKGEVIVDAITRTEVFNVKVKEPPPPEPVEVREPVAQPRSVVTHVPPVIQPPVRDPFTVSDPLPPEPVRIVEPPKAAEAVRPEPPALVEQPRTVEPARAKANLASYVSDEDYPSNAVRNEEQGTTRFKLAVGPDGKVQECTVTSSSGSSALDSTTCKLMRQRARFTPAKNNRGEKTGDTVSSAIRWVLPTD